MISGRENPSSFLELKSLMIHKAGIRSQFNDQNNEEAMYVHCFNRGGRQSRSRGSRGHSFGGQGGALLGCVPTYTQPGSSNYVFPGSPGTIFNPNITHSQGGHFQPSRGGQQSN